MFGYVTADSSQLSPECCQRYGGCYCGLCRRLGKQHGLLGRLTLTYDMTFLVLTLSSLYEPEEVSGSGRCPVHPLKKRSYWYSPITDYAADLNILLTWWNCMDDWEDERRLSRRLLAALLSGRYRRIQKKYPRQEQAIREQLKLLHRYEDGPEVNADLAANCFGDLMAELFVYKENDYWADTLRKLGAGLGRFIYIMDACIDYKKDDKHGHPNPLRAISSGDRTREQDYALLSMLMHDCTEAFEHLPLEQDLTLLRNILYAGVWQRYNKAFYKRDQGNEREEEHDAGSL